MELVVAFRRCGDGRGRRHRVPDILYRSSERMGYGWRIAISLRYALLVYSLNGVSCAECTKRMEGEIAQMGPCCHLLAYRRQLLATDADGTERGRRMGMGTVRVYMDVCHRGHGDEFQKTEGPQ